jgi:plastocyanin
VTSRLRAALATIGAVLALAFASPSFAQAPDAQTQRVTLTADGPSEPTTTIPVGWSIEWFNGDTKPHTIVVNLDGDALSLGEVGPAESLTLAFTEAGEFTYQSQDDPAIHGTVTVLSPGATDSSPTVPASTPPVTPPPTVIAPVPSAGPVTVVTPSPGTQTGQPGATPAPGQVGETPTVAAGADDRPEAPDSGAGMAPTGAFELGMALLAASVSVLALSNLLWSASKGRIGIEWSGRRGGGRRRD